MKMYIILTNRGTAAVAQRITGIWHWKGRPGYHLIPGCASIRSTYLNSRHSPLRHISFFSAHDRLMRSVVLIKWDRIDKQGTAESLGVSTSGNLSGLNCLPDLCV